MDEVLIATFERKPAAGWLTDQLLPFFLFFLFSSFFSSFFPLLLLPYADEPASSASFFSLLLGGGSPVDCGWGGGFSTVVHRDTCFQLCQPAHRANPASQAKQSERARERRVHGRW